MKIRCIQLLPHPPSGVPAPLTFRGRGIRCQGLVNDEAQTSPGTAPSAQGEGGPRIWKAQPLVLHSWDTGMVVNMAPTQPALGSLGVREGCCLSFLYTSLTPVSFLSGMHNGSGSQGPITVLSLGDAGKPLDSAGPASSSVRSQPVGLLGLLAEPQNGCCTYGKFFCTSNH